MANESPIRESLGERLYKEKEFIELTGLCRATLHNMRKKGELGYYRFGRTVRYGESHLRKFLNSNGRSQQAA